MFFYAKYFHMHVILICFLLPVINGTVWGNYNYINPFFANSFVIYLYFVRIRRSLLTSDTNNILSLIYSIIISFEPNFEYINHEMLIIADQISTPLNKKKIYVFVTTLHMHIAIFNSSVFVNFMEWYSILIIILSYNYYNLFVNFVE